MLFGVGTVKRVFDVTVASLGLLALLPLFVAVIIAIKLDSRGPAFFRQERVGRAFRSFRIYKFRTMVPDASRKGGSITACNDPRVTRIGKILRATKIDELPQLINVIKGEMSIVGPRPEVREYVEAFRCDYQQILAVRPGITDPASLKFWNEVELLRGCDNPDDVYRTHILPEKVMLSKQYAQAPSLKTDLRLIVKTLRAVSRLNAL